MTSLTPTQQEVWDLHSSGVSVAEIARRLGRDESSIRERLARAKAKITPEQSVDPAVAEAMAEMGITTLPKTVWFKNDKLSIKVDPLAAANDPLVRLRETFEDLPAAMPIPAPRQTQADLMAVYPIFDLHLGMRAHAEISGKEVDLASAKDEILEAIVEVFDKTPAARRGVIINGGDFTHATDDRNMTRRSSNILDVAGRNSMVVDAAIEVLATIIELALMKHETVEYYSVPGNHDPQNWETLQFALRERYRDNPRVKIDVRWDEFSIIRHGQVSLFIHHGDKRKPGDLAAFLAAAFKREWADADYRMLLTGHLHHLKVQELAGIIHMQIGASGARDHHASSHAYLSHRVLTSMLFTEKGRKFIHEALI